ncbi:MAG TPA: methylmalonyl Co-A mutase-associated GTPase MeaB [Bryobacteraceae bacterium]|jgi:LAO/AO transport system kinase
MAEDLAALVLAGDRAALARAITLVESTRGDHQEQARLLIERLLPHTGHSLRVAITGVPGVGKSTFIEQLGTHLTAERGDRVAVLAIDPSSPVSGGSILGDKTRMPALSADSRAFVRPTPAGGGLGGVHRNTRETILVCEAAGFNVVLVETVGVGQSEFAVTAMTDFLLLLLLPDAGDELQGIKRGIVEVADLIAVNKADSQRSKAGLAKRAYEAAVSLLPAPESGWATPVMLCSALTGENVAEIWTRVLEYRDATSANGHFARRRRSQLTQWLDEELREGIERLIAPKRKALRAAVEAGEMSPGEAAARVLSELGDS